MIREFRQRTLIILLLFICSSMSGCHHSERYHKISEHIKNTSFIIYHKIKRFLYNYSSTVPVVTLPINQTTVQTVLDKIPDNHIASHDYLFKNYPVTLNISDMLPPTREAISAATHKYRLVRPIPFPYYSSLTLPADACGSYMSDVYYTAALIQRKYALDLTSSFFPVVDYLTPPNSFSIQPSFIATDKKTLPLMHSVEVNGELIDNLPAFLTYYYRGWIDHLHGWTSEGISFISLLEPASVTGTETGNTKNLKVVTMPYSRFDGFEIKLQQEGNVTGVVLKIRDEHNQDHFIAIGRKLAEEQQGWEFPLPSAGVIHVYAALAKEMNKHPFNVLGQAFLNINHLIKEAALTVYGSENSKITIKNFRQVPYDRESLIEQINLLREYNIFPIATTNHGGTASWYQELTQKEEYLPIEYDSQKYLVHIPPMGSIETSPTFLSDLFNQFGLIFRSHLGDSKNFTTTAESITQGIFNTEIPYYDFARDAPSHRPSNMPINASHAENIGPLLAYLILQNNKFALNRVVYTHYNFHNKEAFSKLPENVTGGIHMGEVRKLPPASDKVLTILTELKYNRSGTVQPYQRIWFAPISTNVRYAAILQQLITHATLTGNNVAIQSWLDPVSERQTPDRSIPTLDLHGQTFYVPHAATASVQLDGKELTALKRNPKDFTGRESITIVDLTHPKIFFDKLNLLDNHAAKILSQAALLTYQSDALSKPSLNIRSNRPGMSFISIQPQIFDNYETDFFHFKLKKSRPDLKFFLGWKGNNQHSFVATNGVFNNASYWSLPSYNDTEFHDYVGEYSDLVYAKNAPLPRGPVTAVQIGMLDAKPGDFIIVDKIEFLAAPGVKAEENGFVLGGRVLPAVDHVPVTLTYGKEKLQTFTERGGWYFFKKIPKDAIVAISVNYNGKLYTPTRGKLIQAHRNDVEYHIKM